MTLNTIKIIIFSLNIIVSFLCIFYSNNAKNGWFSSFCGWLVALITIL